MAIDFDVLALAPCIAAFGVPCTYVPGAGRRVLLNGIFNERSAVEVVNQQTGASEITTMPTLAIRLADLRGVPTPCESEQFIVNGMAWQIHDALEDGFGQLVVKLIRTQL